MDLVKKNLEEDPYKESRSYIYNQYHPYNDGKSAERMVEAVKDYIDDWAYAGSRADVRSLHQQPKQTHGKLPLAVPKS